MKVLIVHKFHPGIQITQEAMHLLIGSLIECPYRSPDLIPLVFFCWSYLESVVLKIQQDLLERLQQKEYGIILDTLQMIQLEYQLYTA